jgi:hypothetical protein
MLSDWIKLIGCSPLLWMMVINVSWPGIAKIGLKDVSDSCSACTVAIPSCRQYKCTRMLPKVFWPCLFRWNLACADAYADLLWGKHCSFAEKHCWDFCVKASIMITLRTIQL